MRCANGTRVPDAPTIHSGLYSEEAQQRRDRAGGPRIAAENPCGPDICQTVQQPEEGALEALPAVLGGEEAQREA